MPVIATFPGTPSRGQVLDELDTVLASESFRYSYRMCRMLRFLVEHSVEHPGKPIKELLLASRVFDKSESFDSRTDPIVRVEASRLRAKLRDYYHGEGASHRVYIHLPGRGYRPVITLHALPRPERARPPAPARLPRTQPALVTKPSLLVLPFLDLSAGHTEEYFCDGLTEELINQLARVDGLRVVARSSAFLYKSITVDIPELADRFRVSAVLEGSVRREGNLVRISVQLINSTDGFHIWSDTYQRPAGHVFSIQHEITRAIATALKVKLEVRNTQPPAPAVRPADDRAQHLFLRGLHAWHRRTGAGFRHAISLLEQAAAEDPTDPRIPAKLAHCHLGLLLSTATDPTAALRLAEEASERALTLFPGMGEALAAHGFVRAVRDWRWQDSEAEFQQALLQVPQDPTVHEWYATACLAPRARFDAAVAHLGQALDIDPVSVSVRSHLGWVHFLQRRYRDAARELELALELEPGFYRGRFDLGLVYTMMGRHGEAIAAFELARTSNPGTPYRLGAVGYGYISAGRREEGLQILGELRSMPPAAGVSPVCVAKLQLALGDPAGAITTLEQSMGRRSYQLIWLGTSPVFDPLRADRRFQELCRQLGF